jgi:integrase
VRNQRLTELMLVDAWTGLRWSALRGFGLFPTASGHRLHGSAFKRALAWSAAGEDRRIHDLRHTAACLWLARGVDPMTVQA